MLSKLHSKRVVRLGQVLRSPEWDRLNYRIAEADYKIDSLQREVDNVTYSRISVRNC
jgi:hypothetical protein